MSAKACSAMASAVTPIVTRSRGRCGLIIELEITGSGEYRRLMGQLIPRQSAVVDIRHGQGVITVEADTLGRFSANEVPFGQISLRCRLGSDQSPVVTGWITL